MKRVALILIGALLAITAGTASASAAPIDVNATPQDRGVMVSVTLVVGGQPITETITTGYGQGESDKNAGLCAVGVIHTSCTPADEASN